MDCDNVEVVEPTVEEQDDIVMDSSSASFYDHFTREQLIATILKYKGALEKVYTKDQIDSLTGDDKRALYTPESIERSAHLRYVCGLTGKISAFRLTLLYFIGQQSIFLLDSFVTLWMKMDKNVSFFEKKMRYFDSFSYTVPQSY